MGVHDSLWALDAPRRRHPKAAREASRDAASGLTKAQRADARPALTFLGWGNASIGHGSAIRRAAAGPVRSFPRFAARCYPTLLLISLVEYLSSQVSTRSWSCVNFGPFTLNLPDGTTCSPHKLRICKDGAKQLVVDRDVSAAMALLARLISLLFKEAPRGRPRRVPLRRAQARAPAAHPTRRGSVRSQSLPFAAGAPRRAHPDPLLPFRGKGTWVARYGYICNVLADSCISDPLS
jgi:hypothetical protein